MADALEIRHLEVLPDDTQDRLLELERQLEAQRRVNDILLKRIAKSVEIENGAFSLHEQNSRLEQHVSDRAQQLEEINRHLRQEITERRMAEQALRFSEERYRFLMEESQQPFVVAREFEFIYVNPAAARLLGFETPEELIKAGMGAVVPMDEFESRLRRFDLRVRGEMMDHTYEARFVRTDGQIIWCEVNAKVGEFEGAVAVLAGLHDITERKHATAELARANSTLLATLESTADAILVVDSDGRITRYNEKLLEMWDLSDPLAYGTEHLTLIGRQSEMLRDSEEFVARTIVNYSDVTAHTFDLMEFIDGRVYERYSQPQLVDTKCVGRVWSYRDITERVNAEKTKEQLEAQLRQAQKMEAIGTLAGGIAHDFNNILYAIQGYAELVLDNLPDGSLARKDQEEVLIASKRAADLVRQILAFSRQSNSQNSAVNVTDIAREVLRLIRASFPSTIDIRFGQTCENPIVMADSTQLHQILMNLCTNSGQALGEAGGVLEVSLRSEIITPGATQHGVGVQAGNYIVISVQDNGCGMTPQVMERIFDPFYTTKEVGVGTGLGLSTVHGIVAGLGGEITVESEVGKGTTFEIYLPRAAAEKHEEKAEVSKELFGEGHIMFVEDEEPLAKMATEALTRFGYTVEAFTSSAEAWKRFGAEPGAFDLVITDQTMPEITGSRLAEQMLALRPDLPVILCTGFSKTLTPTSAKALGVRMLLEKPIGIKDLAQAARTALTTCQVFQVA
jgi:PAS domain S-box-containing protein